MFEKNVNSFYEIFLFEIVKNVNMFIFLHKY